MSVEEQIKAHNEAVWRGKISCERKACVRCQGIPEEFKVHERRWRIFLMVIERIVRRHESWVVRWRCPLCGKTFSTYPSFALPYKRYVKQVVMTLSGRYVEEDACTYRQGVTAEGMAIGYEKAEAYRRDDEKWLAPSTLWRWVGFLGSLKETLRRARALIRAQVPRSGLFRKAALAPFRKYRTDIRRAVLRRALELVWTEREYRRIFDTSLFPEFATAVGWK